MKRSIFVLLPVLLLALAFRTGNETSEKQTVITPQFFETTNWTVDGRQIKLNGKPFFAKGVGYQPTPVGENPARSPNGDYFTSNYSNIYKGDIDKMADMGVNCIKIYSWFPDKDHSDFLDYAYKKGIYVLVGYYSPNADLKNNFNTIKSQFETLARNTATHPGMMGYQLGNENVGGDAQNPDFWGLYNQIAAALKSIAPSKIVTTGLVDDGMISVRYGNTYMTSLDAWGINVFRGKSLGDFYKTYTDASRKPVLITEIGFPNTVRTNGVPAAMPNNGEATADYVDDVMDEINDNSSDDEPNDPVAGVYYFMWSDEWWKQNCPACWSNGPCACSDNTHDYTKDNSSGAFPGGWWDEEWFGLYTADRQARKTVDVLKSKWK
jgi:exo-beta-1,3-glucanase (GH17 family)